MEISIRIKTDNAAFDERPEDEIERILGTVAGKVRAQMERDPQTICDAPEVDDKLLDINGNTVGSVRCTWRKLLRVKCDTCGWEGRHGELECYRYEDGEPAETRYARCPNCFDEDQIGTVR